MTLRIHNITLSVIIIKNSISINIISRVLFSSFVRHNYIKITNNSPA